MAVNLKFEISMNNSLILAWVGFYKKFPSFVAWVKLLKSSFYFSVNAPNAIVIKWTLFSCRSYLTTFYVYWFVSSPKSLVKFIMYRRLSFEFFFWALFVKNIYCPSTAFVGVDEPLPVPLFLLSLNSLTASTIALYMLVWWERWLDSIRSIWFLN